MPPATAIYHKVTFHQLLPKTKANKEINLGKRLLDFDVRNM